MANLFKECLTCNDKCCKWDIAHPVFVTSNEKKALAKINAQRQCSFFTRKELCSIYKMRPFDCRFFPFDILKINEEYFWITWRLNCPILNRGKENFEHYLKEHESKLIPEFKEHLSKYSEFRLKELLSKYEYEVLREVKYEK